MLVRRSLEPAPAALLLVLQRSHCAAGGQILAHWSSRNAKDPPFPSPFLCPQQSPGPLLPVNRPFRLDVRIILTIDSGASAPAQAPGRRAAPPRATPGPLRRDARAPRSIRCGQEDAERPFVFSRSAGCMSIAGLRWSRRQGRKKKRVPGNPGKGLPRGSCELATVERKDK